MNANVTGRPETAPTAAAPVNAPGTDAGNGDATAKIVANGSDISSVCEAPRCRRRPGPQWGQRHLGRCQFGYRRRRRRPGGGQWLQIGVGKSYSFQNSVAHQKRSPLLFPNLSGWYRYCTSLRGVKMCEASMLRCEAGLPRTKPSPDWLPGGEGLSQDARGGCSGH
jgi:hypothetical protein